MKFVTRSNYLASSIAVLSLVAGLLVSVVVPTTVFSQEDGKGKQTQQGPGGGSGQGAGAGGGKGSSGGGGGGHDGGDSGGEDHEDSHEDDHDSTHDSGGEDDGKRGPQAGKPEEGRGGAPVWAQEGIPDVELGRLNVIRSSEPVLERALDEVVANFDPATMEGLYESSANGFIAEISANWDTVTLIDSPLQNLSLLKELWTTGATSLPSVQPASFIEFSAILLGSASDKNIPVSLNTVKALAIIIGVDLSEASMGSIASRAEKVREAILLAHG